MKARLSDHVAQTARAPAHAPNYIIWDSKLPGFGLRVGTESRVWIVYYRNRAGTQRKMRLGSFPSIGTDAARKLAKAAIGEAAKGADPAQTRAEERRQAGAKVAALLDRYLVQREKRRLVKAREEYGALRAGFGEKPLGVDVASIDRRQVVRLLDTISSKRGAGAAGYFRKTARTFFDWCVDQGVMQGNPLAGYRLPKPTKAERLASEDTGRAITPAELASVWVAADDATTFGRLVRLVMLTGCRRDEAASLERDWIDRKAATITLPARLTKMGRDHVIPITPALSQLLDKCPKTASPLMFPASRIGRRPIEQGKEGLVGKIKGWSKLMPKLVDRAGVVFTLHDLRRSLKTHVRELGFDADIAGIMLGHARDSFEARYDRSQLLGLRRKAAEAYAGMIADAVRKEAGKVVSLVREAQKVGA